MTVDAPQTRTATYLSAEDLAAGYAKSPVIRDVCCQVKAGELLGIVGPNGCGKTTLLKTLSGHLEPMAGRVMLNGAPWHEHARMQRARMLAMLPQHPDAPPGMTVRDLVHCGRTPHNRWFQPFSDSDHTAIEHAMRSCALDALAARSLSELSGGERQRAWIAMTLAQQTQVVLLDEPTAALDIGHQLDVLHLLRKLVDERELAVAMVIHDLNMATRYCDRLLVMDQGRIVGTCQPAITHDWSLLEQVFGVAVDAPSNHRTLTFKRQHRLDEAERTCRCASP